MNYEEFTNQELNQTLTGILFNLEGWELGESGRFFYMTDAGGKLCAQPVISYCTDWGATMPLAIEHGVSLINDDIGGHYSVMISDSDTKWCRKSGALRSIVICLIKKLEQPH